MNKVEFITRIEAARSALPKGIVPLFIKKFPDYNTVKKRSRIQNVLKGVVRDEEILERLEQLVEILKPT